LSVARGLLAGMDTPRFLECLDADYRRLREVAAGALDAKVPTCPEWTGTDLMQHVATVYLHKVETMRLGKWPEPWPPDLSGEPPIGALDRAYAELVGELSSRDPDSHALTWYDPVQTVGWWTRRMAQETVIHRVDAELAAGAALAPIPEDLALDGIDELLECFLSFGTRTWPHMYKELPGSDGRGVLLDAGASSWVVRVAPDGVKLERDGDTDAVVRGTPDGVLRWLWRRVGNDAVEVSGPSSLVTRLRALLAEATV
jgi:uncharacterized protein (TIGR03083 family)